MPLRVMKFQLDFLHLHEACFLVLVRTCNANAKWSFFTISRVYLIYLTYGHSRKLCGAVQCSAGRSVRAVHIHPRVCTRSESESAANHFKFSKHLPSLSTQSTLENHARTAWYAPTYIMNLLFAHWMFHRGRACGETFARLREGEEDRSRRHKRRHHSLCGYYSLRICA